MVFYLLRLSELSHCNLSLFGIGIFLIQSVVNLYSFFCSSTLGVQQQLLREIIPVFIVWSNDLRKLQRVFLYSCPIVNQKKGSLAAFIFYALTQREILFVTAVFSFFDLSFYILWRDFIWFSTNSSGYTFSVIQLC